MVIVREKPEPLMAMPSLETSDGVRDCAYTVMSVSALSTSEYYRIVADTPDEAEARAPLTRGTAQFVVTIPADFTTKLLRGDRPTVLIEADELSARIVALAEEIRQDLPDGPIHLICVLKGAFLFLGDLIRAMDGHVSAPRVATGDAASGAPATAPRR